MKKTSLFVKGELIMVQVFHSLCIAACFVSMASGADAHTSKPVTNGFVFVDGGYLPPPYVLQRKGYALYVNDTLISPPSSWTHLLTDLRVDEDPPLPVGITTQSTFADLEEPNKPRLTGFLSRKARFLYQNHSQAEAVKMHIDFYRSLPFVKSATYDKKRRVILVETLAGEHRSVRSPAPVPLTYKKIPPLSPEQVKAKISAKGREMARQLESGAAMLCASSGYIRAMSNKDAKDLLPLVGDLLMSDYSVDEKLNMLNELELLPAYNNPRWRVFVENFRFSRELEERIGTPGTPLQSWILERKNDIQ